MLSVIGGEGGPPMCLLRVCLGPSYLEPRIRVKGALGCGRVSVYTVLLGRVGWALCSERGANTLTLWGETTDECILLVQLT